jgi:acetyl esterase/lipase
MKLIFYILTFLSAVLSIIPFLRSSKRIRAAQLWIPKLLTAAFAPLLGVFSALGALFALMRRDWKLFGVAVFSIGLVMGFVRRVTRSHDGFSVAFGPGWQGRIPHSLRARLLPQRWPVLVRSLQNAERYADVVYGKNSKTGTQLLADLWTPREVQPTGLGVIYMHGGGWRFGNKDMGTRPLFERLASQGYVVMDMEYTLWPHSDIPNMVSEVKQGIHWLKQNGGTYGVHPDHIVLMGGSSGAHLALLAAYTPNNAEFQPTTITGDTSVRAAIAFYPPTDFESLIQESQSLNRHPKLGQIYPRLRKAVQGGLRGIIRSAVQHRKSLSVSDDDTLRASESEPKEDNYLNQLFGSTPQEFTEIYRSLSPFAHIGPHCPPTLLLQGADDFFMLAPGVRRLHLALLQSGVKSILAEFPHTDHAFDLILPQISPAAQAATYDVERFLALMI